MLKKKLLPNLETCLEEGTEMNKQEAEKWLKSTNQW